MMRRLITLAAIAFATVSMTACSFVISKEDRARQMLQDRYDEEFKIVETYPTFLGRGYYTVLAAPADFPDILFEASVDVDDDNFSDTYVERLMCGQLADKVFENLGLDSTSSYLFVHSLDAPVVYDTGISLADYIAAGADDYTLYLFVAPDAVQGTVKAVPDMYTGVSDKLRGFLRLYVTDKDGINAVKEFLSSTADGVYDPDFKQMTKEMDCIETEIENSRITSTAAFWDGAEQ